jgi:hypothetical protein
MQGLPSGFPAHSAFPAKYLIFLRMYGILGVVCMFPACAPGRRNAPLPTFWGKSAEDVDVGGCSGEAKTQGSQ